MRCVLANRLAADERSSDRGPIKSGRSSYAKIAGSCRVFPILGVAALLGVLAGARTRRDRVPFGMTVAFFILAFLTLGVMFWPYMIPYVLTVNDAAAPEATLRFFFYGGAAVLPVIAAYTIGVYWIFRGKIDSDQVCNGSTATRRAKEASSPDSGSGSSSLQHDSGKIE